MRKIKWAFRQLFPLTYVSEYGYKGGKQVAVFRMWLGRSFAVRRWAVA